MFEKKTNNTEDGFATEFTNDGFNNGGFAQGQQNYAPQGQPMYQGQVKPKKKGKTTKTVLIVLGGLFALLVCCCGACFIPYLFDSGTTDSNDRFLDTDTQKVLDTEEELDVEDAFQQVLDEAEDTYTEYEEPLELDFSDVKEETKDFAITYTSLTDEWFTGTNLAVELENRTSKVPLTFSLRELSINNVDVSAYCCDTVTQGKKAKETINLHWDELVEQGLTDITDIKLTFVVYDEGDYFGEEQVVTTHVYPYGKEKAVKFERKPQDTDNVILDNDMVRVTILGEDEGWVMHHVNLYIENKYKGEIDIDVENMSINGCMVDAYFSSDVQKGHTRFDEISISDAQIEETGITDITDMDFTLEVNNAKTYDKLCEKQVTLKK